MAIFLLDTSVIIDVINRKKKRYEFLDRLLEQENLLACCSINVIEVYSGCRPHEARVTEAFLRSLKYFDITWEIAQLAGELQRHWRVRGTTLSLPDVTIASVALVHGLTLLTDNQKHYPMPELTLLPLP